MNAQIGITPSATTRPARLRADRIRRDTLTALAFALREDDDNSVRNTLDELIDAGPDASDNEIDKLVEDIEYTSGMGRADMPLTPGDVAQLAEQANAALPDTGTVVHLAPQPERRAS